MAFETGTVASAADLKAAIEAFAQVNGWTLTGDILSKGQSAVRLTASDAAGAHQLKIEGANTADFSAGVCTRWSQIQSVSDADWPMTYFLVAFASPDTLWCTVRYAVVKHQWLGFGDLEKYGTWTGGNWFAGARCDLPMDPDSVSASGYLGSYYAAQSSGLPFWNFVRDSYGNNVQGSFLHTEIDGDIWSLVNLANTYPRHPDMASPLRDRNPNAWNQQAVLLPYWIWKPRPDGYWSQLGHLGHVRFIRIDNYDSGDIITLGSDRWMVFPFWIKGSGWQSYGMALRYDGP